MAGALALLITIVALLVGTAPSLAGFESYVVYSGSMAPAIAVGDLVVVQPVRADQLAVGDVLTYRTPQRPDVVITHRLIGIEPDPNGGLEFKTKGDANDAADQVQVDQRAGLGRVAYTVPEVGYLVDFSRRAEGKLLLIGVPGLLLALDSLLGSRRRGRQRGWPPPAKSAPASPAPLLRPRA